MRVLGLDVGDQRIGVAVSDPLGWTAQGVDTITRTGNTKRDCNLIKDLINTYEVEIIVVGLPKNMNGTLGPQAEKIKEFAGNLQDYVGIPVVFWDERLSTVAAEKMLLSADVSRKKRKQVIDKMAASVILQGYLDKHYNV